MSNEMTLIAKNHEGKIEVVSTSLPANHKPTLEEIQFAQERFPNGFTFEMVEGDNF